MPNEPTFSTARHRPPVAPLPLAAIHSTHDEFVPLADVQRRAPRRGEPKRLWIVDAADHRFSDNLAELDRRLLRGHRVDREPQPRSTGREASDRAARAHHARVRHALPALIGLVVFLVALEVLRLELRAVRWHDLRRRPSPRRDRGCCSPWR